MTCKLCSDSGLTHSAIANVAMRCECMRGRVVHVVTCNAGVPRGLHCVVCNPYKRGPALAEDAAVRVTRKAWLPDSSFAHWDPTKRVHVGGVPTLEWSPEQIAICNECAIGFAMLLAAWNKGEPREIARPAPHMNAGGKVIT